VVTNLKTKDHIKHTDLFVPNPTRTTEWLGGVTYSNLEHVLGNIKSLLADDPAEEIHLLVNSYGGATGIGMSFFDSMRFLKPKLVTIGSGDVDSSGIIVFLAGQKRFLTKNTTLLLHLAGRTFEANKRFSTKDMEDMLKEDKLKDYQYACVVSDATNGKHSPENILDLMSKHTILTAEEAVNMGLADKVL
jgi:ATP-dependent Clp protease, protease subunit